MSAERALLRRLVEAWREGGEASHSFEVLTQVLREARALLAEPEGESDAWVKFLDECHDWTPKIDGLDTLTPERAVHITIDVLRTAYLKEHPRPTPRSRAEAEAMVEAHCHAIREHGVHFTEETRVARDKAHAALLVALTGEGK